MLMAAMTLTNQLHSRISRTRKSDFSGCQSKQMLHLSRNGERKTRVNSVAQVIHNPKLSIWESRERTPKYPTNEALGNRGALEEAGVSPASRWRDLLSNDTNKGGGCNLTTAQ